jgi:SnoaL-like polyketide cyclase
MTTATLTEHLLARMAEGDTMFNARDFTGLDEVHHPDMICYMSGLAEPIYGRAAHSKAMKDLVKAFPDIRVWLPYPIQFGSGDWITVVTRTTGTFTGEMTLPDGTVVPPTGKAFDLPEFGQTSKWEGDQLIVISAFYDVGLQARQLGLA